MQTIDISLQMCQQLIIWQKEEQKDQQHLELVQAGLDLLHFN